jgi:hypothetical protein
MTVPPRLDDTDMILSEVIKRFELLHLEAVQNSYNVPTLEAVRGLLG